MPDRDPTPLRALDPAPELMLLPELADTFARRASAIGARVVRAGQDLVTDGPGRNDLWRFDRELAAAADEIAALVAESAAWRRARDGAA